MRGAKWLSVSALAMVLVGSHAASGQPKSTQMLGATLRVLEVTGNAETRALVDHFEVQKRVSWRSNGSEEAVYQGTQESILRMKLHAEGASGAELVSLLMRATDEDPQLARPPMLSVAIPSLTFRGVLESAITRCDARQCEAEIVVMQAQRALARVQAPPPPQSPYEDPSRSPGF